MGTLHGNPLGKRDYRWYRAARVSPIAQLLRMLRNRPNGLGGRLLSEHPPLVSGKTLGICLRQTRPRHLRQRRSLRPAQPRLHNPLHIVRQRLGLRETPPLGLLRTCRVHDHAHENRAQINTLRIGIVPNIDIRRNAQRFAGLPPHLCNGALSRTAAYRLIEHARRRHITLDRRPLISRQRPSRP